MEKLLKYHSGMKTKNYMFHKVLPTLNFIYCYASAEASAEAKLKWPNSSLRPKQKTTASFLH